jgi:hypothetical protein
MIRGRFMWSDESLEDDVSLCWLCRLRFFESAGLFWLPKKVDCVPEQFTHRIKFLAGRPSKSGFPFSTSPLNFYPH